jgi:hypothetical protein
MIDRIFAKDYWNENLYKQKRPQIAVLVYLFLFDVMAPIDQFANYNRLAAYIEFDHAND